MRRFERTDEQFSRIAALLPGQDKDPGRTAADNRRFVDAALWVLRTGAPWRDRPERFGHWNSAFQRFNRWAKKGIWTAVFEAVPEPDWEWRRIDASVIRAHQHAAGAPPKKVSEPAPNPPAPPIPSPAPAVRTGSGRSRNPRARLLDPAPGGHGRIGETPGEAASSGGIGTFGRRAQHQDPLHL